MNATVRIRACQRCGHDMTAAQHRPEGVRRACGAICLTCASKNRAVAGHLRGVGPSLEIDPIAVERLKAGSFTGRPTAGELRRAVIELRRAGLSIHETARRLRCSSRTVQRHRAAARTQEEVQAA